LGRVFKRAYFVVRGARLRLDPRLGALGLALRRPISWVLFRVLVLFFSQWVWVLIYRFRVSPHLQQPFLLCRKVGSPGRSSGAPVASSAVVELPSVGFALVGSSCSSQLASSSRVSSLASPDSADGDSSLARLCPSQVRSLLYRVQHLLHWSLPSLLRSC